MATRVQTVFQKSYLKDGLESPTITDPISSKDSTMLRDFVFNLPPGPTSLRIDIDNGTRMNETVLRIANHHQ